MGARLSPLDASFLYVEDAGTPMHAGGVAIFDPPEGGFDHERLVRLISQRIPFVPRYRQRVRAVPFGIARPVWVDDERFDIGYHVRRSALPKPGTREQLNELVARLMSRPLDRTRPLWEMYLVEGLADGSFAIIEKSHQALIDGHSAIDIAQVMLDPTEEPATVSADGWRPAPEPTDIELLSSALTELATRPAAAIDAARSAVSDVSTGVSGVVRRIADVGGAAVSLVRPPVATPLNVPIGAQRRFATVDLAQDDLARVQAEFGGTPTDAVLAVLAGALRSWLQARGEAVAQGYVLRALLPFQAPARGGTGMTTANRVSATLVDLPLGEPDPALRLQQIGYQLAAEEDPGQGIGAETIVELAGFAPASLHAMGARVGSSLSRRVYNLVITSVTGPRRPMYAAGSRMTAAYPVVPLTRGQALSVGLISYAGGVHIGFHADRDALPDLDLLVACTFEARDELVERRARSHRTLRAVPDGRAR